MTSISFAKALFKIGQKLIDKNCIMKDFRQISRLSNPVIKCNQPYIVKKSYQEKNRKSKNNAKSYFLLGGNLTFFGLLQKWLFNYDEEEEPEYITNMKRSILLTQRGEYQKAEQMLHLALRQAQIIQHEKAITYIYDLMANLAFDMGDYKKAEPLFISVMQRVLSSGATQDDLRIVHMSLKMAKIFESRGDFQKAEDGYKFCMEALKKNPDDEETNFFWLMTLDWYAHMLVENSREKEGYKYLLEAYDLSRKINGLEHEQTITILNDLGTINCRQGEYDLSIKYLNQAIEAGKKLEEFDLSPIHVNLGYAYMKKGLYQEAKKSCKEGQILSRPQNNGESFEEANVCLKEIGKLSELNTNFAN